MLCATFQLTAGLGSKRERRLWQAGITHWDRLDDLVGDSHLPAPIGGALRSAVARARRALAAEDVEALCAQLPVSERWRLFGHFAERTAYLDIETDRYDGITAIGYLDHRGPRLFLAGRDLDDFPDYARGSALIVTFNGSSFDLPILRARFPDWNEPPAHIDLRHLLARLGHHRGLKAIERELGLGRPPHLDGVTGGDAVWLWRHAEHGDRDALRRFAEYNLYDTINLRTLMAIAYNRLVERSALAIPTLPVAYRGDLLYDVSKILLTL